MAHGRLTSGRLCQIVAQLLGRKGGLVCDPQYCHLAQLPGSSLLKFIVTLLGEVPKFGKDRLYSQILDRAKRSEGTMLLILDEAHLLSGDALV